MTLWKSVTEYQIIDRAMKRNEIMVTIIRQTIEIVIIEFVKTRAVHAD